VAPAPPRAHADAAADPAAADFAAGWTALRDGDLPRAAAAFARAEHASPAGPLVEDAAFWGAVSLARTGAPARPDAIAALAAFLAHHPASPRAGEASVMLGWLLLDAGDLDGAAARFTAATADAVPAVRTGARAGLDAVRDRHR
jgi:TolA-binding protein